jgi:hexosaminidase
MLPLRAAWRRSLCVLAVVLGAPTSARAQTAAESTFAIIPRPVSLTPRAGRFTLTERTVIWSDRASARVARQLARYLEPATGFALTVRSGGAVPAGSRITLVRDPSLSRLGREGYVLDATTARVSVRAPTEAGLFHGVQTIRQLLPPEIFREAPIGATRWSIPAVHIEDEPRFGWRGAHLDVARHFMPKEFVKKYIDLLALHKMNSFHWHLTDDQGWRLEVKRYPRLTSVGAWRKETLVGAYERDPAKRVFDRTRHGGFYTQDDVREIVAYARERHVNVVPEIEMPGHAQAAIAAYPELGNTSDTLQVLTVWGVSQDILNPEMSTVRFMQGVLDEVLELFPSRFIHIGGDEAVKNQWEASPKVQARIRELGLKDEEELQSWFIRQMDDYLTRRGRRLIGWDEILEGGLAPNATVMSWRGVAGGIEAARAGHDVVMAPTSHTYLDYYQSRDVAAEPLAIGGFLPLDTVYAYEPIPAELEPRFARHVLGAQVQLWTEYLPNPKRVEYMAFPRLSAMSEVVWTPRAGKDFTSFLARLRTHGRRLEALDVGYRR